MKEGKDCNKQTGVCECINERIISEGKCDACKTGYYDHPECEGKNLLYAKHNAVLS